MIRLNRVPLRAAVLLLAVALAACSDAPTGAVIAPDHRPAALNTLPAPSPFVSHSGGSPLISWSALSGATSYSVNLVTTIYTANPWQTYVSGDWTLLVGTTTGTSQLDGARSVTYAYTCQQPNDHEFSSTDTYVYQYEVIAHFPTGTSSARVYAPVAPSNYCYVYL